MKKINWRNVAKSVGLVGAVLSGASMCMTGDWTNGGGIIFAAFASAPAILAGKAQE